MISGKVGVWLQTSFHRKSREPFPSSNISYSWAWGWKACDGLRKYKTPNVVSASRRNTFILIKERTECFFFSKNNNFCIFHDTCSTKLVFFLFLPPSAHPLLQTSWNLNIVELDLKKKEWIKWKTKMYIVLFHDIYLLILTTCLPTILFDFLFHSHHNFISLYSD